MAGFLDNCRFNPTLGGTTDWTYSSAVTGYQSPAAAGAVNATVYEQFAISADSTQWEIARGAYNSGTGVFARTTVLYNSSGTGTAAGQTGAGTKINFTVAPQVAVVALAEDLPNLATPNAFSDATDSTSSTAGGFTLAGGLSVAKKLFVGLAATIGGILKTTDTTAATSTTTGSMQAGGGLGVAGAGWFGGLVNAALGFVTPIAPATASQFDSSSMTGLVIANGASGQITPDQTGYYVVFVVDTQTTGQMAIYMLRGSGAVEDIFLFGNWVSSTTTPAAGKCSVSANGSNFRIYNNQGSSSTFKCGVWRLA